MPNSAIYIYNPTKYYICMNTIANIQGFLSGAQTANLLGVSAHQVAALARGGEIAAINAAGKALLINAESAKRYQQLHQGKGRPLNEQTAMAALLEISGIESVALPYQQARRLKLKLQAISAEDLVWQARRRATTRRYRCSESFLEALSSKVSLSGLNALNGNFDLTEGVGTLEGYVHQAILDSLIDEFFLNEDLKGNVTLHVTQNDYELGKMVPVGVVAADLAASLNTREHRAGITKLKELLDEYRCL